MLDLNARLVQSLPLMQGKRKSKPVDEVLFYGKEIYTDSNGRDRMVRNNPPKRWKEIQPKEYVEIDDIARRLDCTIRTIRKYISRGRIKPDRRVGHSDLFKKSTVDKWIGGIQIKVGRPRKEVKAND